MSQVDAVRHAIAEVMRPGHFFVAAGLELEWEQMPAQKTPWEIFRGQLVQSHLTRETAIFESWNIYLCQDGQRSGEPLLALKLDAERGFLHVVRGLLCWAWEGYHDGDNVYLSRETRKWVQELVGTIQFEFADWRARHPEPRFV